MSLFIVILIHQILFQGMFVIKNVVLYKKLGIPIRGNNPEAVISAVFFVLTIIVSLYLSYFEIKLGNLGVIDSGLAMFIAIAGMSISILVSGASLVGLKDSWRVGVIEEQKTKLITTGIYKYSRNPYFTSYLLMFLSYAVLLQNLILVACLALSIFLVHKMILKEEEYLYAIHGNLYLAYKEFTPRYLLFNGIKHD